MIDAGSEKELDYTDNRNKNKPLNIFGKLKSKEDPSKSITTNSVQAWLHKYKQLS